MALHMKTDMLLLAKREIYIKLSKASFKITVHATATRATWTVILKNYKSEIYLIFIFQILN